MFGIKLPPKLGHGTFDGAVRVIIETDATLSYALLPMLDARLVLYHCFRELDNSTLQPRNSKNGGLYFLFIDRFAYP